MLQTFSDVLTRFGPLIGVVVGWFLHEISDAIRRRREDRRAAGQLLAEVLYLRNMLLAIPMTMRQLRKKMQVREQDEPMLRASTAQAMEGTMAELSERYNRAIDLAAGAYPALAYQLRSKEKLGASFDQVRAIIARNDHIASLVSQLEETIVETSVIPELDNTALKLAWIHGWQTRREVRRTLKASAEFSGRLLDGVIKEIEAIRSARSSPSSPSA